MMPQIHVRLFRVHSVPSAIVLRDTAAG